MSVLFPTQSGRYLLSSELDDRERTNTSFHSPLRPSSVTVSAAARRGSSKEGGMRPSTITRPVVWYCPSSRREGEDRATLAGRKTGGDGRAKEGGRAWSRKATSWEGVKGMAAGKIVWLLSGKARRESRSVVGVDSPFGAGRQPGFSGRVPRRGNQGHLGF